MRKVISLMLVFVVAGLIGCSSNTNEQALEQVETEVWEDSQKPQSSDNAEVKTQNKVEREESTPKESIEEKTEAKKDSVNPKLTKEEREIIPEEVNKVIEKEEARNEEGTRENESSEGTKRSLSQEKIEEIIKQLNKKVEEGELTAEERDELVEEINNGNLRNVKEMLGD